MSTNKLKTAILGLTAKGSLLLDVAVKTGFFDIVAVGDSSFELAEKLAAKYECTPFDDYRQLVIQNQFDVLFVAAPLHLCEDYVQAAMKKKFNIIKLIPPALDFEQTVEFLRAAKKEKVKFVVANGARFTPGFNGLRDFLKDKKLEDFHLITAVCNVQEDIDDPPNRWLSDPQLAGGGVLLRNCYEIIDQIILNFGIPQQVYSLNTNHAPDKQQRLSITEDTAIVTMKFSDTLMGNLTASRIVGPPQKQLKLNCKKNCLTVSENKFTLSDNFGNVIEEFKYPHNQTKSMAKMLENFALSLLSPDKNRSFTDFTADLNNMAVIESAYLSARTAMPEEPSRMLNMVNIEPANIWSSTTKRIL